MRQLDFVRVRRLGCPRGAKCCPRRWTVSYDPAPPYGVDIERDPDYRKCARCNTWYCPVTVPVAVGGHPYDYICMDCRKEKA